MGRLQKVAVSPLTLSTLAHGLLLFGVGFFSFEKPAPPYTATAVEVYLEQRKAALSELRSLKLTAPPRLAGKKKVAPKKSRAALGSSTKPTQGRPVDVLHAPAPRYPQLAVRRGWEGVVAVELSVDSVGRVDQVRLAESSGQRVLDEAAIQAAQRWRFRSTGVAFQARREIEFKLKRSL